MCHEYRYVHLLTFLSSFLEVGGGGLHMYSIACKVCKASVAGQVPGGWGGGLHMFSIACRIR